MNSSRKKQKKPVIMYMNFQEQFENAEPLFFCFQFYYLHSQIQLVWTLKDAKQMETRQDNSYNGRVIPN